MKAWMIEASVANALQGPLCFSFTRLRGEESPAILTKMVHSDGGFCNCCVNSHKMRSFQVLYFPGVRNVSVKSQMSQFSVGMF